MIKVCVECGKDYEAKTDRSKYCSAKCKTMNYRKRNSIEKICEWCGEKFTDTSLNHSVKYCSLSCSSKYMHSVMLEKTVKCHKCGADVTTTGVSNKVYCDVCKKEVNKESQIKYDIKMGKINPERVGIGSGKGQEVLGKSPYFKTGIGVYRKIKKMSMEELKCERCGSTENLHVHHKDEDRHNNKIENLELLCKPCHKTEHMGGEKNYFSKLTWEKVNEIRDKLSKGYSLSELAKEYGVYKTAISKIKNNKTWKINTKN